MGISDLIPGVSGGTIALMLGIYDRLLVAISGFFSRDWKKHIGFLIPLAIGMGSALLLLSHFIAYLLKNHNEVTQFFFMGIIIGVIPFVMKQADARKSFQAKHIIILLIVAALLALLDFIRTTEAVAPITSLSPQTAIGLFFAGWLASMAMLLPGISGSFILLVLGVYGTAISALEELNLPIIAVIGAGVIVGFIVSSKAIQYLLTHFRYMTFAVILGLIIGSIFVVFPGIPADKTMMVVSVFTFLLGLFIPLLLGEKEKKSRTVNK